MQKRIPSTVTGIAEVPVDDHRDLDVIDVLAQALSEHFPEFRADPRQAPIVVTVEDLPTPGTSAVRRG
jgi:hypothetical protein